jgi:ZIP family zinc transporter
MWGRSAYGEDLVGLDVLAALGAGLAIGVGALPVLGIRDLPGRWHDTLLGLTASIMSAATAFSLLATALVLSGLGVTVVGFGLGA